MNILVLSAGRRVELIKLLKKSVKEREENAKVIAADANSLSPALFFADEYVLLPRVDQSNFLPELIESIQKLSIDVVLPTIDTELEFLSSQKDIIERNTNAMVVISNKDTILTFQNKRSTYEELNNKGFSIPLVYSIDSFDFPMFAKPIQGSSSIGAQVVHNQEELTCLEKKYGELVLQEYVQGEEFTIDCLINQDGKPLWVVPRKRLATRSGEILKGQVIKDAALVALCFDLFEKFRFFGPVTVQVIRRDGLDYIIEVNPRVGGGLPFSVYAGADILGSLMDMMRGKELDFSDSYEAGKTFLRFDQTIEYLSRD